MSFRYAAGFNKPGLNTLVAPTGTVVYNLFSWGGNRYGNLGTNNLTYYSRPNQVGTATGWSTVTASSQISAAIKTDGTLWMWGYNATGCLGNGSTQYGVSSPIQVGALTTWSKVRTGNVFTLAIKTDGTLWSWGGNNNGELGLGNRTYYSSPKQVGSLTTWANIATGFYHSVAVKTDGTLWSWGANNAGQLGLNNRTYYSSPKQIGALTTWLTVSGMYTSTLAIKTDGTIWSWGKNGSGRLGLGNTTDYSSPKQIGALTNWLRLSTSYLTDSTFAVKTDGTLWSWGNNSVGRLGLNNRTSYSSPKQVGSLTTWSQVGNAVALKTDGTVWAWGNNSDGQLGYGSIGTQYSSPKQVGSSTTWTSIASGGNWVLALG